MIPAFAISFNVILPQLVGIEEGTAPMAVMSILMDSGMSLLPGIIIGLVGMAISTVFGLFAQANIYLQIRKKKGIL